MSKEQEFLDHLRKEIESNRLQNTSRNWKNCLPKRLPGKPEYRRRYRSCEAISVRSDDRFGP